jgi:hypothetical protein
MKTYPPFQVITADNGQHVNEALNLAVYAALHQHGLDFSPKGLGGVQKNARLFTNTANRASLPSAYLMYDDRNVRTDILTFDARTQMGALCEFLDNPPKPDLEISISGVGATHNMICTIGKEGVQIGHGTYTHASILALAKAVQEFNA